MERPRDRENCTDNNKAIRRTGVGFGGMNWTHAAGTPYHHHSWYRPICSNITLACLSFATVPFSPIVFGEPRSRIIVGRSFASTVQSRNARLSTRWYFKSEILVFRSRVSVKCTIAIIINESGLHWYRTHPFFFIYIDLSFDIFGRLLWGWFSSKRRKSAFHF